MLEHKNWFCIGTYLILLIYFFIINVSLQMRLVMVQFSRVLGLALHLYGIQILFLCLTLTVEIAKVAISQTVPKSVCLEFGSVEVLNSFIIKYFDYAKNTRFLQYDIQYIKVEASHTDILNILTVLRLRRQLDHMRSCKRRNKDYINSPISKKQFVRQKMRVNAFL